MSEPSTCPSTGGPFQPTLLSRGGFGQCHTSRAVVGCACALVDQPSHSSYGSLFGLCRLSMDHSPCTFGLQPVLPMGMLARFRRIIE